MRPPPFRCITGTTARDMRNMEATLTSITCRHSARGISVNARISSDAYRPALLTSTSIEPHRSTASATSLLDRDLVGDVGRQADAVGKRLRRSFRAAAGPR